MAIHFSILAWEIPWKEETGRLQSMRLQRVGHDLETKQQDEKGDELKHPKVLNSTHSSGLMLDQFSRTAITTYHKCNENNSNIFSHSCGSQSAKSKCREGWLLLGSLRTWPQPARAANNPLRSLTWCRTTPFPAPASHSLPFCAPLTLPSPLFPGFRAQSNPG